METEFRQEEIERLIALERKFGKEGLTFDDVLLLPAESHVLPNDVSTVARLTPAVSLDIPLADVPSSARMAGSASGGSFVASHASSRPRSWSRSRLDRCSSPTRSRVL